MTCLKALKWKKKKKYIPPKMDKCLVYMAGEKWHGSIDCEAHATFSGITLITLVEHL